jgi:CheY-like chemotaxis protein
VAATLAVITASISGLGLVGYLYGASNLYSLPKSTVIALQTASFILAVSLGLVMSIPERGLMCVLSDSGSGGVLARRILPVIVLVPILIGFVRLKGERAGLYDTAFGSSIRRVLEDSEATVYEASSSSAALDLLKGEAFDVIVSDIGMPNGDGYELMSEVRTRGIDTPALALTAFARAEDRVKAMSSGYQAHVSKPVETDQLLGAVAVLVAR